MINFKKTNSVTMLVISWSSVALIIPVIIILLSSTLSTGGTQILLSNIEDINLTDFFKVPLLKGELISILIAVIAGLSYDSITPKRRNIGFIIACFIGLVSIYVADRQVEESGVDLRQINTTSVHYTLNIISLLGVTLICIAIKFKSIWRGYSPTESDFTN